MSGGDHKPQDAYAVWATGMSVDVPWDSLTTAQQAVWQAVVDEVTGGGTNLP